MCSRPSACPSRRVGRRPRRLPTQRPGGLPSPAFRCRISLRQRPLAGFSEPSARFEAAETLAAGDADYPLGVARAQLFENFIVAQNGDSLLLVDQHAAHERLVYERFKAQLAAGPVASQALLIPGDRRAFRGRLRPARRGRAGARTARAGGRAVRAARGCGARDAGRARAGRYRRADPRPRRRARRMGRGFRGVGPARGDHRAHGRPTARCVPAGGSGPTR